MSKAIFHLKLLENYQLVNEPGTYYVSVAYTIKPEYVIGVDNPRYIVPLKAVTPKNLEELISRFEDDEEMVQFDDVKKYFMSGVLWLEKVSDDMLPVRGEKVLATFDYVDDVLRCTNIELLPRYELDYINLNKILLFRKTLTKLISESYEKDT